MIGRWLRRGKKKGPAPPPRSEVLRARPLRNPAVTWGPDARGDMVIHVPLAKKPWLERLGRFFPGPDTRHILLDDVGADVWEMCDGQTSIETICRNITEKYRLNRKEAEASLIEHLRQLARRKLVVTIAGPETAPEPAQEGATGKRSARRRPARGPGGSRDKKR